MKTDLSKRFKIIALLIMSAEKYSVLDEKIGIVADAIDCDFPQAEEMVCFLEDFSIKIAESVFCDN
jgi:hypothetical protein